MEVIAAHKRKWRMHMCAGAIDSTHTTIVAPEENQIIAYVNGKGNHSIYYVVCREYPLLP